ncbi:MAG: type II toxin-antitoxin system RelE/ParE family toxin [Candidatus Sericytochromatia bacterium]|nr:type II toxin-antitoxin system RelE/ParE family toxin [Candidatus Sericytochromatia bacterium]
MIRGFRCRATRDLFLGRPPKRFPASLLRIARRKLIALDSAVSLADLRVPPGNRLEELRGDRAGQHSIRINAQWRICFTWSEAGAEQVELVDYH